MGTVLLSKLRDICEEIHSIEGEWPIVVGSVGYVLLGYLDWTYLNVTKDIDIFSPNIDSFEVADKLMEKGWAVVHYTFTNAVYIDNIPVEILSNTMPNMYIPTSLYNHWIETDGIRVMDAPGILISQAIYRNVSDLIKYLKKPISVSKIGEYLRECEDEIKNMFGSEKFNIVKDRIEKFIKAQEVILNGDRARKYNSYSGKHEDKG